MSSDNKKIQIIMEDLSYLARSFENAFRDSGVQAEVVDVSDASIHITEEKMYAYISCFRSFSIIFSFAVFLITFLGWLFNVIFFLFILFYNHFYRIY